MAKKKRDYSREILERIVGSIWVKKRLLQIEMAGLSEQKMVNHLLILNIPLLYYLKVLKYLLWVMHNGQGATHNS